MPVRLWILLVLLQMGMVSLLWAQCPGVATGVPGFRPPVEDWACAIPGVAYQQTVTMEIPDSVQVGGIQRGIEYLIINDISNIPCELHFSIDRSDRTYQAGETACITFSGTTIDLPGQYNLGMDVSVKFFNSTSALPHILDKSIFFPAIRVQADANANCAIVDTAVTGLIAGVSCRTTGPCPGRRPMPEGFKPPVEEIPCIVRGEPYYQEVSFTLPDTIFTPFGTVPMEYIVINELRNLPLGINYQTPEVNGHRYFVDETVCFVFYGTTNRDAGQYNLELRISAKAAEVASELPYLLTDLGYHFALRVQVENCMAYDPDAEGLTATGIGQILDKTSAWQLYPNPTTGLVTVTMDALPTATSIQVYNLQGAQVLNQTLAVGTTSGTIDISHQPAGMYLLHLSTNDKLIVKKLIKE